jgi:pimeloyl-ACP methyl ester carboxylesterase
MVPMVILPGSGGVNLAGDVLGHDRAPAVLLLHGGGQTRHSWKASAGRLADAGYYVVNVDLRGHGESDWSQSGCYSVDDFADDVRGVATWIGRPAVLVGASLGGISSMLAVTEPPAARCLGLVLVDVVPAINPAGRERIGAFMRSAPEGFASVDDAADAVARYLPHRPRPADVSGLRRNLRRGDNGRWHWHFDPRFLTGMSGADNQARLDDAARRIEVPTLLIRGERSEIVDEDGAAAFRALVPHAEERMVDRAAHMVAGDQNDHFTEAVFSFLASRQPPLRKGAPAAYS